MKKIAIGLASLIGLLFLGLIGAAATQPDMMTFERSKTMQVSAEDVWPHVSDHALAAAWSPWSEKDPGMTREFSEPSSGEGSTYSWSGNDEVGVGSLTNTKVIEGERVEQVLEFTSPWQSTARCGFDIKPVGDAIEVTWYYEQDADFNTKLMMVMMDLEAMLGPEYEKGLDSLEQVALATNAERLDAERAAEEARLAEEAAAEEDPSEG